MKHAIELRNDRTVKEICEITVGRQAVFYRRLKEMEQEVYFSSQQLKIYTHPPSFLESFHYPRKGSHWSRRFTVVLAIIKGISVDKFIECQDLMDNLQVQDEKVI